MIMEAVIIALEFQDQVAPGVRAGNADGMHGGFGTGAGEPTISIAGDISTIISTTSNFEFARHGKKHMPLESLRSPFDPRLHMSVPK
jgi:hypothetical protein